MSQINSIFDWVKQVKDTKDSWENFTEEDKDKYNNYMINRVISMNPDLLDIVNLSQIIPPQDKRSSYLFYQHILPKDKKFYKYIKTKNKVNEGLISNISRYFSCGRNEAKQYHELLSKQQLRKILENLGNEEKQIKKML